MLSILWFYSKQPASFWIIENKSIAIQVTLMTFLHSAKQSIYILMVKWNKLSKLMHARSSVQWWKEKERESTTMKRNEWVPHYNSNVELDASLFFVCTVLQKEQNIRRVMHMLVYTNNGSMCDKHKVYLYTCAVACCSVYKVEEIEFLVRG